jgi:hypothetical protein
LRRSSTYSRDENARKETILSLFLMAGFFGATKLLPMALDLVVVWAAITDWMAAPPTG